MLFKITIIISVLVIFNFLLLIYSCNKTEKSVKKIKKPVVIKPKITIELEPERLAPTGS